MICWAYLLYRALRRQHVLHMHRHCAHRAQLLHQQYIALGLDLLRALQAERQAAESVKQAIGKH